MNITDVSQDEIGAVYNEIRETAEKGHYHLNPDRKFAEELIRGLIINRRRYGYDACPCRLCIGPEEDNKDIICPCYYRDEDILEYGSCYCGLYVSEDISRGKRKLTAIPERRNKDVSEDECISFPELSKRIQLQYPVHRCNVCGYLCARDNPPERCPVCGAVSKRFQVFIRKI